MKVKSRIVTTREMVRSVAARWEYQYQPYLEGRSDRCSFAGPILKKLKALDPETASAEEVNKIIGNAGWTMIECQLCEKSVDKAVELDHDDGESGPVVLCGKCLEKLLAEVTR